MLVSNVPLNKDSGLRNTEWNDDGNNLLMYNEEGKNNVDCENNIHQNIQNLQSQLEELSSNHHVLKKWKDNLSSVHKIDFNTDNILCLCHLIEYSIACEHFCNKLRSSDLIKYFPEERVMSVLQIHQRFWELLKETQKHFHELSRKIDSVKNIVLLWLHELNPEGGIDANMDINKLTEHQSSFETSIKSYCDYYSKHCKMINEEWNEMKNDSEKEIIHLQKIEISPWQKLTITCHSLFQSFNDENVENESKSHIDFSRIIGGSFISCAGATLCLKSRHPISTTIGGVVTLYGGYTIWKGCEEWLKENVKIHRICFQIEEYRSQMQKSLNVIAVSSSKLDVATEDVNENHDDSNSIAERLNTKTNNKHYVIDILNALKSLFDNYHQLYTNLNHEIINVQNEIIKLK